MSFPGSAFLYLGILFLGAAAGSLLCIVFGKAFHKKYYGFRLSLCFLLLAAAVAFFVLLLLNIGTRAAGADSASAQKLYRAFFQKNFLWAALYFFAGLFSCASLKIFFPLAAACYVAFTFFLAVLLYREMPLFQTISISVSESSFREQASLAEYKFVPASGGAENLFALEFLVYELNENVLLPLPHVWYALRGAVTDSQKAAPLTSSEVQAERERIFKAQGGFFKKRLFLAFEKILGPPHLEYIPVPAQQFYPALFDVKVKNRDGKFFATLEKIM